MEDLLGMARKKSDKAQLVGRSQDAKGSICHAQGSGLNLQAIAFK